MSAEPLRPSLSIAPPATQEKPAILLRSALEIAAQRTTATWLLKPHIERGAMILMFGAEGTLKSFAALDMALQVAAKGDPVVFLHAEGRGLWKRLRAWCAYNRPGQDWQTTLNGLPFLAVERPLNLSSGAVVLELVKAIDATTRKPALIVDDTMTRNSDGNIERSNEDATAYLNQLDSQIRARYGAAIILIHHIGHSNKDRARGPFSLIANTDANFLFERPDLTKLLVTVRSGRMKDCAPPPPFTLEAEVITIDGEFEEDRSSVTSLAIRPSAQAPTNIRRPPAGKNQQLLLGALREHVRNTGNDVISSLDVITMARTQGIGRNRLSEIRASLVRDGWITDALGGVRLLEGTA